MFTVTSLHHEEVKINLLRIILGIILVMRSWDNLTYSMALGQPIIALVSIDFILSLMILFGVITPIAILLLFFLGEPFIEFIGSGSLGMDVRQMILLVLIWV